ncbi:hypothetical protein [Saccharibacillus kuerlensis]|uniref:Secreted protein n=1 Tax=Saccharibacillus kuerlensis TaxID=459527 RepID=A0ABQ2L439_9BACL|nr:hypothetical protein [Saccharibacillus kuerlensis]GGO00318.1 hypothetical protein GCM10010969_21390 [Saccharibacillus kuerlensis]
MSGTRNRARKKIPALAAMALMTALTGSVLPTERAAAAPAGSETGKTGGEAKKSYKGSKPRRDCASTDKVSEASGVSDAFLEEHPSWKE